MPSTGRPSFAARRVASARPRSRSHASRPPSDLLPGTTTRSASASSRAGRRTAQHAWLTRQRLDVGEVGDAGEADPATLSTSSPTGGARLTADLRAEHRSDPLVEPEAVRNGQHAVRRPPVSSGSRSSPGSSRDASPRNLLTTNPATSAGPRETSTATVPKGGEHPAAVDVADDSTGQPGGTCETHVGEIVRPQVDLGRADPAPSQITASIRLAARPVGERRRRRAGRGARSIRRRPVAATWPRTTSCDVRSHPGFSRTGLIRTLGATRAARACMACARPISPPSTVTAELLRHVLRLERRDPNALAAPASRHSPATTIDLAGVGGVPATSSAPLTPPGSGCPHRFP